MPARGNQASPDEDHVGEAVELGQLSHGVEDDDGVRALTRYERRPSHRAEAAGADEPLDLLGALGMARSQQQAEHGDARDEPLMGIEDGCLLARMGAAGDPQGAAGRSALRFPVTTTRSGRAPSATIRRASSSDCMAKTATPLSIRATSPRTRR
jgi:hypothetical protein